MSYPVDLDEYPESRLEAELTRRRLAREDGVCDYCGRSAAAPPCRMETRHSA